MMKRLSQIVRWLSSAVVLAAAFPTGSAAQLISVKTVPIAAGDQFALFPSQNAGMGGVQIAVDDLTLDPFVNPAKGVRLDGGLIFTSPVLYDVAGASGSGRSLPLGALVRSRKLFGGFALAMQQLEPVGRRPPIFFFDPGGGELLSEKSSSNLYVFAMGGLELDGGNAALGGSLFWAGLDALEGVDLLYPGSQQVDQSGHLLGVRLGLFGELDGGRTYEALLLYNGLDMTHDVSYMLPVADPTPGGPFIFTETETNLDRTDTWGLHLGYTQPLADDVWRVGGIVTGNYKLHPKIPNYELMNIPRDPGESWAFNFGLGISREFEGGRFGADLVVEPIRSDTWAEAVEPVTTASGKTIPAGERTVENEFRFTNALIRLGVTALEQESAILQFGLQVKSFSYGLEQTDWVEETMRRQDESWFEWTPSLGLGYRFSEVEVRYVGQVKVGTGTPGVAWTGSPFVRDFAGAQGSIDYLPAPSGPLTLQDANVWTHQVSVVIPIRG